MKNSILQSIYNDVNNINWSTNTVKQKAINFITNQFNHFINEYGTLMNYIPMSKQYWMKCIQGKYAHILEIKSKLASNNILDVKEGLWSKDKRVLAYKLNTKYILTNNTKFTISLLVVPFFNTLENNELQALNTYTLNNLNALTIEKGTTSTEKGTTSMDDLIYEISRVYKKGTTSTEKGTIVNINEEIESEFVTLKLDDKKYRYKLENAITFAKSMNVDLIQFKDKFYLNNIDEFIKFKQKELEMFYHRQIFNIENKIFYSNRNETNFRLDHNLTGLKKDLFQYLKFHNEFLKERDIINAQFAIAAHINPNVDPQFVQLAQDGHLYEFIANSLDITRKQAKGLMFRIAFDKVKHIEEFDMIRELFPLFMEWVDSYKKENGYKAFSNLLQTTESKIMIDGLLKYLYNLGFDVFTVHDSVRCKESDLNDVSNAMTLYFESINFKCSLSAKEESNVVSLETKEVSLEEPKTTLNEVKYMATKQDYINQLNKWHNNIEAVRFFRENKDAILNELVTKQLNKKQDIINIVTKYNYEKIR